MKILFITPFVPNFETGGGTYTSQLLIELSKVHKIDLVYFKYQHDISYLPKSNNIKIILEETINFKYKLRGFLQNILIFPLFSSRYNKEVCNFLNLRIKNIHYDYVYFDYSQTFVYAKYINHPNKILMSHDIIAQKYSRMKTYLFPWVKNTEKQLLRQSKVRFTFSDKDCELIKNLYKIDSYSTTFFLQPNVIHTEPQKVDNYFIFFGIWMRKENLDGLEWFLDNVYEKINKNINFKIIGKGLPKYLINRINNLPNVSYLGFVDNPYKIISEAKAEIAILRQGAGVKVKCVEALACGTPVIGTKVAFEGISKKFAEYMILADSPEKYISIINNFDITLDRKLLIKQKFISGYNNKAIIKYINNENM